MARARPAEGELGRMTRSVAERVIYEENLMPVKNMAGDGYTGSCHGIL